MRVEWAIPCMGLSIEGGIIQRIENTGWDKLATPSLPAPLRFIVLIRAVGLREDFEEAADRRMSAQLAGPGLDELLTLDFEIPTGAPDEDHPEGWEVNANVPVVIEFTPEEAGAYTLTLNLRDRFAWGFSFRITEGT
jgi:hypothetical protein